MPLPSPLSHTLRKCRDSPDENFILSFLLSVMITPLDLSFGPLNYIKAEHRIPIKTMDSSVVVNGHEKTALNLSHKKLPHIIDVFIITANKFIHCNDLKN